MRCALLTLDYFVVDAFTTEPLGGNPLAVVINTCGLTTERMQAIAREFNLSETTFVERRPAEIERVEGVHVRIFTPREELPFAGHPTLGTAAVLKVHAPEIAQGDTVTLTLKVGPVPVRFEEGDAGAAGLFGEMTQRDPEFGTELDPKIVARLTGLSVDDLDPALPPQVVSTGTAFAIVVLQSLAALERLKVNQEEATAWLRERGARWFYVLAPSLDRNSLDDKLGGAKFGARMQFYGGEDPATGSAAGCAIAYLVARGAVASALRVHVRQGVEMGRPSDLFLSARKESTKVSDVRVAGSTVLVAKGQLFLP
jgi:trans-2,3-dihydro-3-hydroxyanthranilate isomerase